MNLQVYLRSVEDLIRALFAHAGTSENAVVVGAARELVVRQALAFFPEPKVTGWLIDPEGRTSGQIDVILSLQHALRLPSALADDSPHIGVFATQAAVAFEVKSGIAAHIDDVLQKTWQCHRMAGGLVNELSEKIDGSTEALRMPTWVPICVIGACGFASPETYLEHFEKGTRLKFTVNQAPVDPPGEAVQLVPEVLIDLTHSLLLVANSLRPEVFVERLLPAAARSSSRNVLFTAYAGLPGGATLAVLMQYVDAFRSSLRVSQLTEGAPLADVLRRWQE